MLKKRADAIMEIFKEATGGSKGWRRDLTGESERYGAI
jgi:hypothetical protein